MLPIHHLSTRKRHQNLHNFYTAPVSLLYFLSVVLVAQVVVPVYCFMLLRIMTTPFSRSRIFTVMNSVKINNYRVSYSTRLFGTKKGSGVEGSICFSNDQNVSQVDEKYIFKSLSVIREILDYPTYDVTLVLGDDAFVQDLNREYRGMDKSTDILSFPFYDDMVEPGILPAPDFDFEDYYCLGDMMISVPYVLRQIEDDHNHFYGTLEHSGKTEYYVDENGPMSVKLADDRGVSAAMSHEYNLEKRIALLLIHGMLHLLGYDHIEDDDYLLMVKREEEVMEEWNKLM